MCLPLWPSTLILATLVMELRQLQHERCVQLRYQQRARQCEVQGEVIHQAPTLRRMLKLEMAYMSMQLVAGPSCRPPPTAPKHIPVQESQQGRRSCSVKTRLNPLWQEISLPYIQSFNVFQPNNYNVHGFMPSFQGTGPALPAPLAQHQPLPAVAVFGLQPLAYPPQLPVHHAQIPSSHYPSLPQPFIHPGSYAAHPYYTNPPAAYPQYPQYAPPAGQNMPAQQGQGAEVAKVPGKNKKVWTLPSQIQANSTNAPFRAKHSFNVNIVNTLQAGWQTFIPLPMFGSKYNNSAFSTSIDIGCEWRQDCSQASLWLQDDSMELMSSQEWQIIAVNMPRLIEEEWIPEGYFAAGSDLAIEVAGMFANLFCLVTQQILNKRQSVATAEARKITEAAAASQVPALVSQQTSNTLNSNSHCGHVPFITLKWPLEASTSAPSAVGSTNLQTTRKK
ncbi:hypothetical protein BT96DRAFT_938753 [Gymnopus androsaceus JB14]|uniref:Uncharacterized protein n=1 Tax=Gymnopus androsaceus JB14 TaxID=1447944 RepID=A0A6A4HUP2_9AGAR|nr:hypothetical protein BT96DRAFT_938753 [Gymnopus androsaceus JB14]